MATAERQEPHQSRMWAARLRRRSWARDRPPRLRAPFKGSQNSLPPPQLAWPSPVRTAFQPELCRRNRAASRLTRRMAPQPASEFRPRVEFKHRRSVSPQAGPDPAEHASGLGGRCAGTSRALVTRLATKSGKTSASASVGDRRPGICGFSTSPSALIWACANFESSASASVPLLAAM